MAGRRTLVFATAGAVAALVYFGASEFLAGVLSTASAPLLVFGQTLIPLMPTVLIKAAIAVFGTHDKLALIITIAAVGVIVGGLIGLLGRTRRGLSLVLLAGLGVLPIVLLFTTGGTLLDFAPALGGVLLGCAVYLGLLRLGAPEPALVAAAPEQTHLVGVGPGGTGLSDAVPPAGAPPTDAGPDRRMFFGIAAGLSALGIAAIAAGQSAAVLARNAAGTVTRLVLPRPASSAPPVPDGAELDIEDLAPIVTPNAEFYRIDTALVPPAVAADSWSLRIHGMVDREVTVTMEELLGLPLEEHYVTLTCVSNEVGGDLIGNAKWLGYPIRELLARAGPQAGADMVLSGSDDGFTASTPLEVLTDDRAALLAVGMNGEPLPRDHGFPARLVVPGLYGFVSATKWVTSLEVTRFADKQAYWTTRGWSTHGPVLVASRVDVPRAGSTVAAQDGRVVTAGMAWAQHSGIEQVQVRIDNGDWNTAELSEELTVDTWRQWRFVFTGVAPGSHTVTVRATDKDGNVQISDRRPAIPGSATGLHDRDFRVD
ncbi:MULTISPECIES: molybdopterin-dependent oxidoreductase [Brevibacterium]|jgi:DMSO/TMAO reductase YedYZ molybdopterin-dependent catalytic subunit|uniref:Molybdopterin-dependent oxidoreductase n=1 Tax=Brevibacterium casei TaxID=33889 RepID=A0A7T4DHA2_9MICO|nr:MULTISPECIES: molybdopterin-dependent oxidoreductase [Brevibacterium]QQB13055.1 molybdopterin-dependent oxidoreductase [Brevibacterium casei]